MDDEGELREQGRYAIDFDLKDFPIYLQQAQQTQKYVSNGQSGVAGATTHDDIGTTGHIPRNPYFPLVSN